MKFETALTIGLGIVILLVALLVATGIVTAEWLVWNHMLAPQFGWPHQSWLKVWMWGIVISWALMGTRLIRVL